MKLWTVTDTCYECSGNVVAVFLNHEDAASLCNKYPWLSWSCVHTDELQGNTSEFAANSRYEEWFNNRTDRILRERTHDCD